MVQDLRPAQELRDAAMAFRTLSKRRELDPVLAKAASVDDGYALMLDIAFRLSVYDYDSAVRMVRTQLDVLPLPEDRFQLLALMLLSPDQRVGQALWRQHWQGLHISEADAFALYDSLLILRTGGYSGPRPWQTIQNDSFRLSLFETALVLGCLNVIRLPEDLKADASRLSQRLSPVMPRSRMERFWSRLGSSCAS